MVGGNQAENRAARSGIRAAISEALEAGPAGEAGEAGGDGGLAERVGMIDTQSNVSFPE